MSSSLSRRELRDDSRRKEGSLSRRSGKTGIGCRFVPKARPVRPLRSRLPGSSGRGTCGDPGAHRDSLRGRGPGRITLHSWPGALSHLWAREEACRQGISWGWMACGCIQDGGQSHLRASQTSQELAGEACVCPQARSRRPGKDFFSTSPLK